MWADEKQLFNYCVINFVLCETINCQLLRAFHPSSAIQLLCKSKPLFGAPLSAKQKEKATEESRSGWSGGGGRMFGYILGGMKL